ITDRLRERPPPHTNYAGTSRITRVQDSGSRPILDLRPVYHRLEERIRAHVILCWLALLLIRIAETTTQATWPTIRRELDRLHLGTFTGPAGTFRQLTELTRTQRDLLNKLGIPAPKKIVKLTPETR
ncbi:hypothetical protein ACFU5K_23630, partial [Streptomyces sp. NPDC057428]